MTTKNSGSMLGMFSTYRELICFFIQSNYYFVIYLLGLLIIDQLFLGSIDTLYLKNNLAFITRVNEGIYK